MAESSEGFTPKALECPVCLGEFHDPLIIPCHHSFCRSCLERWVSLYPFQRNKFMCPVCKAENEVPRKGVGDFPKSFIVEQMKDLLPRNSAWYPPCESHPGEDLRFFCQTCEILICRDCKPLDHDGHKAERIQDVAKEMRAELNDMLRTVRNDLDAIRKYNREIEMDNAKLNKLKSKAVSEIRKRANDMKSLIGTLARHAEEDVKKQFDPIQENIDEEFKDSAQRHQSLTRFRADVKRMLEQGKDHVVIENYKTLLRKYDATSEYVFSSWFRKDRDLEKFENIFRKGVANKVDLGKMFGSVEDCSKPKTDVMPNVDELINGSYTEMLKKRFSEFRKSGMPEERAVETHRLNINGVMFINKKRSENDAIHFE